MSKYAESDIEAIKKKIDILDYLEGRGFDLQSSGPTSYKMVCPIHKERTPSFHVNLEYQSFHCFGCGAKGDIISLVQELDNLNFPSAVQELAETAGIKLQGIEDDPDAKRRKRLRRLLEDTSTWYRYSYKNLPENHPGKQNFSERNLLEQSLADETVGWAPSGGLTNYLTQKGYTEDEMLDAGVLKKSQEGNVYEAFRSRITWSIEDAQGHPIGYSARQIMENDNGPKYLNTSQTLLYNKSRTLLGLSRAKKDIIQEQTVYIVEGQTDVMAMNAAGYNNTVASCGTAFGPTHASMLMQLAKMGKGNSNQFKLVFCFDGDTAGVEAAKKVFQANKDLHLNSYVVSIVDPLGKGTDPCDLRKFYGDDALKHLVQNTQVSIVEFILKNELSNWQISTPEGQSGFISKAFETLSIINDKIQYNAYLRKIALWTGVPFEELLNTRRPVNRTSQNNKVTQETVDVSNVTTMNPFEEKILISMVKYPDETLTLLHKYKLTDKFFQQNGDLYKEIIFAISEERLNQLILENERVSAFLHDEVVFDDVVSHVDSMIRAFMRYSLKNHMDYLNSRMNEMLASSADEVEAFTRFMEEQAKIEDYYNPDKRATL